MDSTHVQLSTNPENSEVYGWISKDAKYNGTSDKNSEVYGGILEERLVKLDKRMDNLVDRINELIEMLTPIDPLRCPKKL